MKKTLFALMALTLVCAITLSSCSKKEEDPEPIVPKTKTELLTQSKGWMLIAATSSPAFPSGESQYADLFNSPVINDWDKDDVFYYGADFSVKVNPGAKLPPSGKIEDGYIAEKSLGAWKFKNNETILEHYYPFFYEDDEAEDMTLVDLTETKLVLQFKWQPDLDKKTDYTWIYTFAPKK